MLTASTMLPLGTTAPDFRLPDATGAIVGPAGRAVPAAQKPSAGCNIKWKPGNAPDYFR